MTQLMYAASDKLTSRQDLVHIPTPAPMGRSHSPYPFSRYVDQVEDSLNFHGFTVVDQEYVVTKDDQQFFGMMEIANNAELRNIGLLNDDAVTSRDWTIQVGLRGSHNQTLPRGLLLGSRVIVCSNLCFHGNIGQFKTKQTTALSSRLPSLIRECLTHVPEMVEDQDVAFDRMKERAISTTDVKASLVSLLDQNGLSAPQLAKAWSEWKQPSFDHGPDHNVWRFFNAATQALKPGGDNVNMALVEQRSRVVSDYCTALAA
jgi:hypothetical protein